MLTVEAPQLRQARPALGGESTLDELLVGAWEGLTARRMVACVVCGGPMAPPRPATAQRVEGRCEHCGCELS